MLSDLTIQLVWNSAIDLVAVNSGGASWFGWRGELLVNGISISRHRNHRVDFHVTVGLCLGRCILPGDCTAVSKPLEYGKSYNESKGGRLESEYLAVNTRNPSFLPVVQW